MIVCTGDYEACPSPDAHPEIAFEGGDAARCPLGLALAEMDRLRDELGAAREWARKMEAGRT